MGKRKGRNSCQQAMAAARKRARTTLPSRFECPFCNMHSTVVCTLVPEQGRARVQCEQCKMRYDTTCKVLTEPVDVYHEWLDACEEAVQQEPPAGALKRTTKGLKQLAEEEAGQRAAAARADALARSGGGAAVQPDGELQLTPPPALQRSRRGAQLHPEALFLRSPSLSELPRSPRSPLTGRRRVEQVEEGLEHTMRGALHAGAALHDPVAASLLAERTGMWGAAATGALPAGSSHLQQLARRQHHHTQPQLHEEGDYTGSAAAAAATAGGSSCMAMVAPPLRHGTDVVGGAGGAGGIRSTALRKQTEEQRQLLAVRAFGSFEDTAD